MADQAHSIEQQLERRLFHLETLQEIGREIYSLRAIRPILKTAAMMICGTLGIPQVVVCLAKRRGASPTIVHLVGLDRRPLEEALVLLPAALWETRDRSRVRLLDQEGEAAQGLAACGVQAWLPLRIDRDLTAGIGLGETMMGVFPAEDLPFLTTLCEQTEVALRNAYLYQHLKRVNTKRREEIRRTEALYRITLVATTGFDQQRLIDEIFTVLLEWLGVASGKLCLPPDPQCYLLATTQSMPHDAPISAQLEQVEEEVRRRGVPVLSQLGQPEDGQSAQYALCLPVKSKKRDTGILLVIGDKTVRRVYRRQLGVLTSMIDQMMLAIEWNRLEAQNQALEIANRQMQEANRLKSRFLANMSHELRTPLNAVIAMSDILLEQYFGTLNDQQTDYLKDIHESGQHLLSLINDILDLSKVEAGHSPLEVSEVNLKLLLEGSLTIVRERALVHGIALSCEAPDDLPVIVADERKVKQVVFNLLSNAVKFTPDGGQMGVKARPLPDGVEVCVWDTGIGIAAEDQAKVFDEFEQAESSLTRKYEGTGLGLALVKRFVEQHGGRVRIESEPGHGSWFYFTLPMKASGTGG